MSSSSSEAVPADTSAATIQRLAFAGSGHTSTGAAPLVGRVHTKLAASFAAYDARYDGVMGVYTDGISKHDCCVSGTAGLRFLMSVISVGCLIVSFCVSIKTDSPVHILWGASGVVICCLVLWLTTRADRGITYWRALRKHKGWPTLPRTQTRAARVTLLLDSPEQQAFLDLEHDLFDYEAPVGRGVWHTAVPEATVERLHSTLAAQADFEALTVPHQERTLALACLDVSVYGVRVHAKAE